MMLTMNKNELMAAQLAALNELIDEAGGCNHLSKMLGVNPMVIKGWTIRGRVSPKGAAIVQAHPTLGDKFSIQDLRPDL